MLDFRIIDHSRGRPADGVHVTLERHGPGERQHVISDGVTAADGSVAELLRDAASLEAGRYCITCRLTAYFASQDTVPLFPEVHLLFDVREPMGVTHLRLYISGHSYTVLREP